MDALSKIAAFIMTIVFFFCGGGPTIGEYDTEPSTKLTQTDMVSDDLLNEKNVTLLNLVLLSACFNYCKHEKYLSFLALMA